MAIGKFFIGTQNGKTVFSVNSRVYRNFHINVFGVDDANASEIHVTGTCPVCGRHIAISTQDVEWDGLETLVFKYEKDVPHMSEPIDPDCEGCGDFCDVWNPEVLAVMLEEIPGGEPLPWTFIKGYPKHTSMPGYMWDPTIREHTRVD